MLRRVLTILAALCVCVPAFAGVPSSPTPFASWETTGSMFRRLDAAARGNNPVERPPYDGGEVWTGFTGAAYPGNSTAVAAGATYFFNSHFYTARVGGTTAASASGPTTCPYGTDIQENTVRWICNDRKYAAGATQSSGPYVYRIRTAGTPTVSASIAITSITLANGFATVTTTAPHGLLGTPAVTLAGQTPSTIVGTYVVTITGASTFTFPFALSTAAITVAGTATPAGPGNNAVSGVTDGTMVWDYVGPLQGPTLSQATAHDGALTRWWPVAASSPTSAGSWLIPGSNGGVFRFEGGIPAVKQATGVSIIFGAQGLPAVTTSNCWPAARPLGIEPTCSAQIFAFNVETRGKVEINAFGSPQAFNIIVDGRYVTKDPFKAGFNGATNYYVLDFSQISNFGESPSPVHSVRLEVYSTAALYGVYTGPSDMLSKPQPLEEFGSAFFGTSLTQAAAAALFTDGYPTKAGYMLGLPNALNFGVGGTGLLNPGTGSPAFGNYQDHAILDIQGYKTYSGKPVKLVSIDCCVNDIGATYTNAQIVAAIEPFVQSLRAEVGNDALIVWYESPVATYNTATAVGVCTVSGSPATAVSFAARTSAADNGAFVVSSGSGSSILGTPVIHINGADYETATVATSTTATLATPVTAGAGTYNCYATNPFRWQYEGQKLVKAEVARLGIADPYLKYISFSTGSDMDTIQNQGTGNNAAADSGCQATGSGSTLGSAYFNVSNSSVHPNSCGYRSIAYGYVRGFRKLLWETISGGAYVIP